jgi:hypothetical protein
MLFIKEWSECFYLLNRSMDNAFFSNRVNS